MPHDILVRKGRTLRIVHGIDLIDVIRCEKIFAKSRCSTAQFTAINNELDHEVAEYG